MNILYYDCFAGISGDMNLAAMIDLGVDPDHLRAELSKLGMDDEFRLDVSVDSRHGLCGTRVDVSLAFPGTGQAREHSAHRNLADIEAIILGSGLRSEVKQTSLEIFRRIAQAEARVHGKPLDEVHFHEVGATDSIVDIVGAAICLHSLGADAVWSSPVELGGGFVRCAHGTLPVPAPATVEILHGVPTTRGAVRQEATTPTGAAILATLADVFTDSPAMTTLRSGCGIGHRDSEIPNVLRVHLARAEAAPAAWRQQPARLLQCNIDDMTGEMLGAALDLLMEQGAMDVHFTPIIMKKNRPATCLSLLCAPEEEERFKELLFRHTSTLGVKSFPLRKSVLDVEFETLETAFGPVRIKHALLRGERLRSKPELEDCRALAQQHGLPLARIYEEIQKGGK
ncbi:nickel pincer cofactor biosynthesis protein LarC [Paucidesulfovibrio longus]|uniref:nickel pincer cofactor biosynthesis protein LarC n=1 Tax=Paucidesulfovibrio longus TaxID=889 RepID=UPI0003B52C78|nr:nickel pincer cofactor biosynthesis protein LarC [Paucidesulfovibrio longus]